MFSRFLLSLLFVFFTLQANAQITPADQQRALRNLEQSQQKQENFLKHLEDEKERAIREKKKPVLVIPGVAEPETTILQENKPAKRKKKQDVKPACFNIETIELQGATILHGNELNKITMRYTGSCMGIAEIDKLMHEITNFYIDKGYVTTRIAIPQQNMQSGRLQLLVMEGVVEDIILNENTRADRAQIAMAFPFIRGKLLNLRDIEQGLDQLNRLASSNATMQLLPGNKPGGSRILITNKVNKANRASLGYDNSGQNSTGKNKGLASLERDNLLRLGDAWSFNYNKDTASHSGVRGSEVYAGNFSLPFGYWNFSQNFSHSEYNVTTNLINQSIRSAGQTDSSQSKIDRVIYRNQDSKLSLNTALKLKNAKATDEPGTYNLSILNAGIDYTLRAFNALWSVSSSYERGLDAFGARNDADALAASNPSAQFNKYIFDASVYKPFTISKANLAWRTVVSGQKSPDHLFGSERISIGDRYSVRGFDNTSILGDSGGYMRNELAWNLPQFTENKYINNIAGNLQPYIGVDAGATKLHLGKDSEVGASSGYVSGWATGIRNNSQWLSLDLAYAQAINAPAAIATKSGEVYFTISTKFGF